MPMVGGVGVKNCENLLTSLLDGPKGHPVTTLISTKYNAENSMEVSRNHIIL